MKYILLEKRASNFHKSKQRVSRPWRCNVQYAICNNMQVKSLEARLVDLLCLHCWTTRESPRHSDVAKPNPVVTAAYSLTSFVRIRRDVATHQLNDYTAAESPSIQKDALHQTTTIYQTTTIHQTSTIHQNTDMAPTIPCSS